MPQTQRPPLPFDPELKSLLPNYDDLIRQGQIPVKVEDIILPGVEHTEHTFPGPDGNELVLSIFRKENPSPTKHHEENRKMPTIYHIHGGGLIMGNRFCNLFGLLEFVLSYDVVVTSIEYRLAPMHRFPSAVEDCYAGLEWVHSHADELGIDREKIDVNGLSAGAGLAAAICLLSRDRSGPSILGQSLFSPMLDDRNDSASANEFIGIGIWDKHANGAGWDAYLGSSRGSGNVSPYAAPSRATDLSNLPQASWIRDRRRRCAMRMLSLQPGFGGMGCSVSCMFGPGLTMGLMELRPRHRFREWRGRRGWIGIRRVMGL
ncbi:Alpha/Beta hydrolase protein [Aspergillus undulatus]|uniref:Alpha/Beta hydrolase protein n=1 Tax=Aspergillus undulatus TaxID=1810928 RepID=UPI003CCE295D